MRVGRDSAGGAASLLALERGVAFPIMGELQQHSTTLECGGLAPLWSGGQQAPL